MLSVPRMGRNIMQTGNLVQTISLADTKIGEKSFPERSGPSINPQPASHFMKAKQIPNRRLLCSNYNLCLDLAAANGWDSFTCEFCSNYNCQKYSIDRWIQEGVKCRALIDAVANLDEYLIYEDLPE
jgi:hypothetical protein